jgi:hypothetical protein
MAGVAQMSSSGNHNRKMKLPGLGQQSVIDVLRVSGRRHAEGGFKITTGSSVSCIAVGKFASD